MVDDFDLENGLEQLALFGSVQIPLGENGSLFGEFETTIQDWRSNVGVKVQW